MIDYEYEYVKGENILGTLETSKNPFICLQSRLCDGPHDQSASILYTQFCGVNNPNFLKLHPDAYA